MKLKKNLGQIRIKKMKYFIANLILKSSVILSKFLKYLKDWAIMQRTDQKKTWNSMRLRVTSNQTKIIQKSPSPKYQVSKLSLKLRQKINRMFLL